MNQPSAPSPGAVVSRNLAFAFVHGLGMGGVVWLIAEVQRGSMASFTMAVVLLASASAAAVAYLLSSDIEPAPLQRRVADIHGWLGAIGSGVLVAILALNTL